VAQRVGRGIAILLHDRGTRRWWVVSSTPRPHFTPGKDPVPILQEAGWATGPVWTGRKSRPTGKRSWNFQPVVSHYTFWANRPTSVKRTRIFPVRLMRTFRWNRDIAPLILNLDTRSVGWWAPETATVSPVTNFGLQSRSSRFRGEKTFLSPLRIGRSVAQSLYWLS